MTKENKGSRRQERTFAFKVLYSLCFTPAMDEKALKEAFLKTPDSQEQNTPAKLTEDILTSFAWSLVQGVWTHQDVIDAQLKEFSRNWRVERIGKVELTILRLAIFELLYTKDVPPKVIINSAVELSKQFGDNDASSFVNGILGAAAKLAVE